MPKYTSEASIIRNLPVQSSYNVLAEEKGIWGCSIINYKTMVNNKGFIIKLFKQSNL